MQEIPFFDARAAYAAQADVFDAAFRTVLGSGSLILGPEVAAFEAEFARWCGAGHALGVASGTDAIELALRALDLPAGSEVVCPNITATASCAGILRAGLAPVIVDVDPVTLTLDAARTAEAIGERTAAILAVHLYGRAAPVAGLTALGIPVIEDVAQAHGLDVDGRPAGSTGVLGCFSFYPTKNLGAFGDGGAVVTSSPELAARVRLLRTYGQDPVAYALEPGLNSRLDELQAAFLRVRLHTLDAENARRHAIAQAYDEALGRPSVPGVNHLYVVRSTRRDELQRHLAEAGIGTGIHYAWTLDQQPAYAGCRRGGALGVSTRAVTEILSLPCHAFLSDGAVERVAAQLAAARGLVDGGS